MTPSILTTPGPEARDSSVHVVVLPDVPERVAPSAKAPERPIEAMVSERIGALLDRLDGRMVPELYRTILAEVERGVFRAVLERTGGQVGLAAKILGVDRNTVARKARALGIPARGRGRPRKQGSAVRGQGSGVRIGLAPRGSLAPD